MRPPQLDHQLRLSARSGSGYADQSDLLQRIGDAGQHLLGLINNIFDMAKIESGHMELYPEVMDMRNIVAGALSTAAALLGTHPVELRQEGSGPAPLIYADPTRVRQVLLNLLSNAAKFTEVGHITVRIIPGGPAMNQEGAGAGLGDGECARYRAGNVAGRSPNSLCRVCATQRGVSKAALAWAYQSASALSNCTAVRCGSERLGGGVHILFHVAGRPSRPLARYRHFLQLSQPKKSFAHAKRTPAASAAC